jgi:hypothetical protein
MHFSVKNDALPKTLAILIFNFQAAEWASPFLNFIRAGQAIGFPLSVRCCAKFEYISFSGLVASFYFVLGVPVTGNALG